MSSMTHQIDQPEKRESGRSKAQESGVTWALIAILGLALGLRIWGIGFGLPYEFTNDEGKEVHRAFKLAAGEYSWVFGKGGLYYLLFVEYGLLYLLYWTIGWVENPREFALLVLEDRTAVFLIGRVTVALMGTLTCLIVFWVGRRIYGWQVGLGAAFIGATAYGHGMWSHVINVDIGMTLALWASILAYLNYEQNGNPRWLIGAGVLAGIAIAFKLPGAIVLLPLLLAIGSHSEGWQYSRQRLKKAGILVLATMVTLTVVAPEWTTSITSLQRNFSQMWGGEAAAAVSGEPDIDDAIRSVTMMRRVDRMGYVRMLLDDHNLALTLSALLGAGFGLWRRQRWDVIWTVSSIVFIGVMSAADRGYSQHYLLPVMPYLWLLSSQAITVVSGHRVWLRIGGLALIVALPLVSLVRQNHEWTKPDTRVVAKEWVEANVPSGAKILMDGYRYRFIPSPPLTPNEFTVSRKLKKVPKEGETFARGISERTLDLYAEAMERVEGPTYELHSTVWGLKMEDPAYYVESCFDYIVTSSYITDRYAREPLRERFPQIARFYEQLNTDPRFRLAYSVAPEPWSRSGPTITVYEVVPTCEAPQKGSKDVSDHPGGFTESG